MLRGLAVVLCLCATVHATLFEDQKGANNWLLRHVGDVTDVQYIPGSPVAIVSTTDLLAALHLRTGNIQWRRETPVSSLQFVPSTSTAITISNDTVYAWNGASEGQLLWNAATLDSSSIQATCVTESSLVLITSTGAQALSLTSGARQWQTPLEALSPTTASTCSVTSDAILITVVTAGDQVAHYSRLGLLDGVTQRSVSVAANAPLSGVLASSPESTWVLAVDNAQLCVLSESADEQESESSLMTCGALSIAPGPVQLSVVDGSAVLAVAAKPASHTYIFRKAPEGGLAQTTQKSEVSAVSNPFNTLGKHVVLVAGLANKTGHLPVSLVDVHSGDVLAHRILQGYPVMDTDGTVYHAKQLWAGSAEKALDESGPRMLFQAKDGTLVFMQSERTLWTRLEGLASVSDVTFLDLPPKGNAHVGEAHMPLSLRENVEWAWLSFKSKVGLIEPRARAQQRLLDLKTRASSRTSGVRDSLGMRKLLLAVTASGQLFALHSGDGNVLWRSHARPEGMDLVACEVFHVPHEAHEDAQALLIFSKDTAALAVVVNAYTGKIIQRDRIFGGVTHVQRIGHDSQFYVQFLLANVRAPFQRELEVQFYPKKLSVPFHQPVYLWAADRASGAVSGYMVNPPSELGVQVAHARHVWALALPQPLLAGQPRQQVPSEMHHVKVQGDRSLRFRYLNPNMALLVSGCEVAGPRCGVTITVLDTVSGRLLHQQHHTDAHGPVATAFFDNNVAVQFWDRRSMRWHFAVMELYDRSTAVPTSWDMVVGTISGSRFRRVLNVSSHIPPSLEVLTQSFFTKMSIRSMLGTTTLHSVTPRHLLIATGSDQVYEMDTRFVDARRPKVAKPTNAHREERLIPYQPQLPLMPTSFATYDEEVMGVKSMVCEPTRLESTTHVMAWGKDLYFVTLRPAKGFDLLDEDFSYAALILALVALLVGVLVMSRVVKSAKVKSKWQ